MQDIGLIGEYFTYQCLAPLNGYKKFIFNCYLPKADGETTEVDVILLHESGIYVLNQKLQRLDIRERVADLLDPNSALREG